MNIKVCMETVNLKLIVSMRYGKKQAMSDKDNSWTKAAADSIKRSDEQRASQADMQKRESEIIKAKGQVLWEGLCRTMQADIDAFNAELAENDPRRLRIAINGNYLTAARLNNYPLAELVAELRLEFFNSLEYRYRRRNRDGERLNESLEQIATTKSVNIALDNAENAYFSHDGQPKRIEDISRLLLEPLPQSR